MGCFSSSQNGRHLLKRAGTVINVTRDHHQMLDQDQCIWAAWWWEETGRKEGNDRGTKGKREKAGKEGQEGKYYFILFFIYSQQPVLFGLPLLNYLSKPLISILIPNI
jgi:hypothetical protein